MNAPPAPALLVIDDLAVAYADGGRVLEHLALELAQGEIGCLVGSSGCGKTTLLRALAGFLPVARGTIEIDGVVVSGPQQERHVAADAGRVHPVRRGSFGPGRSATR